LEREPRGFPALLFASVFTVLLAGAAGYFLWWLTRSAAEDEGRAPPPSEAEVAGVEIGPVDHAPGTVVEERQRVDELVDALILRRGPKASEEPAVLERAVVGQGVVAVPRLLDALHRLHAEDRFAGAENRARAAVADRVLRQIRRALPPTTLPAGSGLAGREEPAVVERRVKAWFLWWRARTEAGSGAR
jgi:hypothetical protein